jgi:hypothetical protein
MSDQQSPPEIQTEGLTIRRLAGDEDRYRLERLAQLDSRRVPEGRFLGVEVEGRLLAAISLETGESIADPFSRTAELRALLELRAAQLRRRGNHRRRLPIPRARVRGALAGSPPGAPAWLIARRPGPS